MSELMLTQETVIFLDTSRVYTPRFFTRDVRSDVVVFFSDCWQVGKGDFFFC